MRYLKQPILSDLKEKMVFLGGPRQVGKSTFALSLLKSDKAYLNWDEVKTRKALLRGELPAREPLIVMDEIHKYSKWRNLVKGFHDTQKSTTSFLVTGSARLDLYRRGGDSLMGRYHYYRMHPFSWNELVKQGGGKNDIHTLLRFGGFPEPLFKNNPTHWRRWNQERISRVLHEDLRDLESVKDVSQLELLLDHLPSCVGSPLSLQNLRKLLEVSHESVSRWVEIFERLYLCYRIPPFGGSKIRAVKKEQKLYFWDWSLIPEEGPRFENLVASQLLKFCHFTQDTSGHVMELRYLRDTDKREVDFVVLKDRKPIFGVEAKLGAREISPHLRYFTERLNVPKWYQVHLGSADFEDAKHPIRILPFTRFCQELELP